LRALSSDNGDRLEAPMKGVGLRRCRPRHSTRERRPSRVISAAALVALLALYCMGTASPAGAAPAPSAPCVFWGATHSCESTNPQVTLEVVNERETSLCTFHETWTWGDGSAAEETTLHGSFEGTNQMLGAHTYSHPGSYTISVSGYVVSEESGLEYTCEAPTEEYSFTLLPGSGVLGSKEEKPVAPVITNFTQAHRKWREGKRLAKIAHAQKPPVGTAFSFALNEPATVNLGFARQLTGRMVRGKCVQGTPAVPRSSCIRVQTVGALSFTGRAGVSTVSFQGRLSSAKKLAPGTYTLTITATNTSKQQSAPRSLTFTVVR
jgi:hypothetical protein